MANTNFKKLLSIHLQSNDPKNFKEFVDSLEKHIENRDLIEICVKIDDNDEVMNSLLKHLKNNSDIDIKYISTPLLDGFSGLWRSMNDLLLICEKDTYFVWNMNDEMRVPIIGWDNILIKYVGTFSDDLFRLRTSRFRSRTYADIWECCFAPETSAITTKKWITTCGNWNPTLGPDTFNQLVAYYFSYHDRYNRDREIRDVVINDFIFEGEGASLGYNKKESLKRLFATTKSWFKLVSYESQQEASKRSQIVRAQIYKEKTFKNESEYKDITITYNSANVLIKLRNSTLCKFPYKISRLKTYIGNFRKSFNYFKYGGAGYDFSNHNIKGKLQIFSNQFSLYIFHIILRYKLRSLYNLLRKIGLSKYIFHKKYSKNIIYKIIFLLPKHTILEAIKLIKFIFLLPKHTILEAIKLIKFIFYIMKNIFFKISQLLIVLAKNIYNIKFIKKIITVIFGNIRHNNNFKKLKFIYYNNFKKLKFIYYNNFKKLKFIYFKITVRYQPKPLSDTDYKNFINKIDFSDLLSCSEFSYIKNKYKALIYLKILLLFKFYNLNISEIKNNRDLIYFSLTDIRENKKLTHFTNNDINLLFNDYSKSYISIVKLDYILKTKFNYNLRKFLH